MLTVAIIFASLVCGAFGMSFQIVEPMNHTALVTCDDGMCASDDAGCLNHCLSRVDAAEERLVIAPVSLIIRVFSAPTFLHEADVLPPLQSLAPPWQSHRLFAFRE